MKHLVEQTYPLVVLINTRIINQMSKSSFYKTTATADEMVAVATSAANAATSATQAATSASNASTSETNAASSATSAANTLATFQQQYHGPLASAPTSNVNAGDLWFNTTSSVLSIYDGSNWQSTAEAAQRAMTSHTVTSSEQSAGTVTVSANYTVGLIDVYLNGLHLGTSDFTATNGTSVTIANPTAGDIIDIIALSSFNAANYGTLASKNNVSESDLNITIYRRRPARRSDPRRRSRRGRGYRL